MSRGFERREQMRTELLQRWPVCQRQINTIAVTVSHRRWSLRRWWWWLLCRVMMTGPIRVRCAKLLLLLLLISVLLLSPPVRLHVE